MSNDVPSKVLNKDLWEKLDGFEDKFNVYCLATEKRMTYLETVAEIQVDDIKMLKKRDNLNNMLTTAFGAIAAFVGFRN